MANVVSQRFTQWTKASLGLERVDPFAVLMAQYIARVDIRLELETIVFASLPQEQKNTIEFANEFTDHIAMSGLWVMGGYELLRTLDERIRRKRINSSIDVRKCINSGKLRFARLRMPLAKLEPSYANRLTDTLYPGIGVNDNMEIAWQVSEEEFISRKELSDLLLNILEDFASEIEVSK